MALSQKKGEIAMEHRESQDNVAGNLNLCDRVKILDAIVHSDSGIHGTEALDRLLEVSYPSFVHLCEDLRGEREATKCTLTMVDQKALFSVIFIDGKSADYQYDDVDTELET